MNVSATGLNVRCFNVTISIGCDCIGSLTCNGLTGSRLAPKCSNVNRMVVPKGKAGWLAYVSEFVEDAKASGLVQKAIDRVGPRGSAVAPPAIRMSDPAGRECTARLDNSDKMFSICS